MKLGWPLSFIFHILGIFGGIFMFSGAINSVDDVSIIPVEIISIGEQTNIRAARKIPENETVKVSDDPMRVETPTPIAEEAGEPAQNTDSAPKPTHTEVQANSSVESNLNPDEESELEASKLAEAPKAPSFNLDQMSALIDQTRSSQPDANQGQALQSELTQYEFAKTARDGSGLQTELTMSEVDALRARMYTCWRISADAKNAEDLVVRVRVQLFPDGRVRGVDLLDRTKIASSGDPYAQIAAERALRAVSKCAPYDFLPEDKYASWKDMELSFRPDI